MTHGEMNEKWERWMFIIFICVYGAIIYHAWTVLS